MPTLGTSGLGRSLRKTTTFVVGTREQSLSSLPINSSISVYQVATENRGWHWVPLNKERMQESVLCSGVPTSRSPEIQIAFQVGTAWHQVTYLSLQALNWEAGHQPGHLPEDQETQCVWTLFETHWAWQKWKYSSWPVLENTEPVELRINQVSSVCLHPFSSL